MARAQAGLAAGRSAPRGMDGSSNRGEQSHRGGAGIGQLAAGAALGIAACIGFVTVAGVDHMMRHGTAPPAPQRAAPIDEGERLARLLVRSTLMTLDDANRTGNYAVLRQMAAPSFQQANSAEGLQDAFASLRARKVDLSVAALAEPEWLRAPEVGADRLLRLIGGYQALEERVRFALAFEASGGGWRLVEIHVATEPAGAVREGPAGTR